MSTTHYILLFATLLISVVNPKPSKRDAGNANDYIDKLLVNVREFIKQNNMDPYTAIDYNILNVRLTGELHGLDTLRRAGETQLTFNENDNNIVIDGVFGVDGLKTDLQWSVHLGFFPFNGYVTGTVSDASVIVTIRADLNTKKVRLVKFKVGQLGRINVETKTLPIPFWDTILSLLSTAVSNLMKTITAQLLEGPIHSLVQQAIDKIGTSALENLSK